MYEISKWDGPVPSYFVCAWRKLCELDFCGFLYYLNEQVILETGHMTTADAKIGSQVVLIAADTKCDLQVHVITEECIHSK